MGRFMIFWQAILWLQGINEYDFGSLTDEQIDRYSNLFGTPEMFVRVGEQLVVLPVPESELEKQVQKENVQGNTYSIYQLKQGDKMRDYSFASISELQKRGLSVNPENYEKVYEAPKTDADTLDSIYYKFNMEHPQISEGILLVSVM